MRWPSEIRRQLREIGLLGINERNAQYTLRWNKRERYPRVDNKLLTKQLCEEAGIPTARVIGAATVQAEVRPLVERLAKETAFALKPARGAMGNGILIVRGREGDLFRRTGGSLLDEGELRFHASSIISGLYALAGNDDVAFAEECLEVHPSLREISADGVPDIRIVVYRGVPVMAMTRLPTRASRGRANLHHGAVGAGVDLATGKTNHAVHWNRVCSEHPDTAQAVTGRLLPSFDMALEIAVRATATTELGYVGADVVVDAKRGPLILELNARPGLAVQVANRAGLRFRLEAVDTAQPETLTLDERLELGRELSRLHRSRTGEAG